MDVWDRSLPPPRDELLRRVEGIEGLLSLLTDRVDDELLDAAGLGSRWSPTSPSATTTSMWPPAHDAGSRSATRRVLTEATADLAFALLLARRAGAGIGCARDRGSLAHLGPVLLWVVT